MLKCRTTEINGPQYGTSIVGVALGIIIRMFSMHVSPTHDTILARLLKVKHRNQGLEASLNPQLSYEYLFRFWNIFLLPGFCNLGPWFQDLLQDE